MIPMAEAFYVPGGAPFLVQSMDDNDPSIGPIWYNTPGPCAL